MNHRLTMTLGLALAILLAVASAPPAFAGGEKCRSKEAREGETVHAVEGDVHKPLRTGGPVPAYPAEALDGGVEGTVVTRILIEKDGSVSDAEVVESLGEPFDASALEAVRQWTFEPATLDGEPVRVNYHITINFKLDGKSSDA